MKRMHMMKGKLLLSLGLGGLLLALMLGLLALAGPPTARATGDACDRCAVSGGYSRWPDTIRGSAISGGNAGRAAGDARCGAAADVQALPDLAESGHRVYRVELQGPRATPLSPGITTRVSLPDMGSEANAESRFPAISADGRYVAFQSAASNMVGGDENGRIDIFVRDRQAGRTYLVSATPRGEEGNFDSEEPSISADGRYVAFQSSASDLVYGDENTTTDVFVRDMQAGRTNRVSVNSYGQEAADASGQPAISADGRYVAFLSWASNLVISDTNRNSDIFVHDRQTGETTRVSVASNGREGNARSYHPAISADGRHVAFVSHADNLVANDTNNQDDIFVHDRETGQTTRVSIAWNSAQANSLSDNPSISADGRYVAFDSRASNLVISDTNGAYLDVFVYDRHTGQIAVVSVNSSGEQGNSDSGWPAISADGRYVAFVSYANNLVGGDTNGTWDVFLHDRQTGQTTRVSVTSGGGQGDGPSEYPAISPDGRYVAFESDATRLVSGDTNGVRDVFLHDRGSSEVDLWIESVAPIQTLVGHPLVRGKTTAVRVVVGRSGESVSNVSIRLDYNGRTLTTFYVADPANLDARRSLVRDHLAYPLSFTTSEVTKTVYFFGDGLTPATTGPYVVSATVDYLGAIGELNETNNTASATASVYETRWPPGAPSPYQGLRLVYVRADWGETPPLDFVTYANQSSAFVRSAFPVAADRFATERLPSFVADSTAYRGADGQLDDAELRAWFLNLNQRLLLSRPNADGFVAVLPDDWFQNYTTECQNCEGPTYLSTQLGLAQLNDYGDIAGYVASAHELGHVFGLCLDCEQYNPFCNPNIVDGVGNAMYDGLWVEERRLMHYSAEWPVYSFMGAVGDYTYWVDADSYGKLLDNRRVMGGRWQATEQSSSDQAILVAGTLFDDGRIELDDWYVLNDAQVDALVPGDFYLRYLDADERELSVLTFTLSLTVEEQLMSQVPFVFRAPYITDTARIVIGRGATEIVSRTVSAHLPTVTVTSPNGGEIFTGTTTVSWNAADKNDDRLSFTVLYSPDGGATWNALATGLTASPYAWDVSGLPPGNQYRVKVMATDGFNTGEDVSDGLLTVIGHVYLPVVLRNY